MLCESAAKVLLVHTPQERVGYKRMTAAASSSCVSVQAGGCSNASRTATPDLHTCCRAAGVSNSCFDCGWGSFQANLSGLIPRLAAGELTSQLIPLTEHLLHGLGTRYEPGYLHPGTKPHDCAAAPCSTAALIAVFSVEDLIGLAVSSLLVRMRPACARLRTLALHMQLY